MKKVYYANNSEQQRMLTNVRDMRINSATAAS